MALAIHATTSNAAVSTSSLSFSHDGGSGSDRLLVVRVGLVNTGNATLPTITGVTFNGVALTKKVGSDHIYAGSANVIRSEYWYLEEPATGSNTIVITGSATIGAISAVATTYTGADTLGPNTNTAGGNLASYNVSLTTTEASSLIDGNWAAISERTVTPGTGVTLIGHFAGSGAASIIWAGRKAATGGADTWAITLDVGVRSAVAVVEVLEAAAAPSTFTATGTGTLGTLTATGSAGHVPPTFSATGATNAPMLSATGSATHTAPTFSASGASTLTTLSAIGTATYSAPIYSADGAITLSGLTAIGTAEHDVPIFTATGAISFGALSGTGSADHDAPIFIAAGTGALAVLEAIGSAIHDAPTYTATGTGTIGSLSATGAATFQEIITLNVSITTGTDDALQSPDGSITLGGTSIRLDVVDEWAGFRFQNVTIPQGATITSAYWEIERGTNSASPNIDIYAQAADNAGTFINSNDDISSRPRTTAVVNWNAALGGVAGDRFQSPNIASVIQEVVDRAAWASGNSLALIIDCIGGDVQIRTYNNSPGDASLLHIEYTTVDLGTFTATGTGTLGNLTATGDVTFAAQTSHTATGAITLGSLTAQGTDIVPTGATPIGGLFLTITRALVEEQEFVATGQGTMPALEASGAASHDAPIFSAAAATNLSALTAVGTADHNGPVFTASGTASLGALSGNGSASFATALFEATGSGTLGNLSAIGNATHDAPIFTATGQGNLPSLTGEGDATHADPVSSASGGATLGTLSATGTASFITIVRTGSGAPVLPLLSGSGAASYVAPIRTATGALVLSVITGTGIAANDPSTGTGQTVAMLPALLAYGIASYRDTGPRITYNATVEVNLVSRATVEIGVEMAEPVEIL